MSSRSSVGLVAGGDKEKEQISTEFSFYGKSPDEQIKKAKHLSSLGKFHEAVSVLTTVANAHQQTVFSDQAYYEIGKIFSNIINPGKDLVKAREFYRKVIADLPESTFDAMAEDAIKNVEKLLGDKK